MKKVKILFLFLVLSATTFAQENQFSVKMGLPFTDDELDLYPTIGIKGVFSINLDMVHYFNKRNGLVLSYSNIIISKYLYDKIWLDSLSNVNRGFSKEFRIGYKARLGRSESRCAFTIEPLLGISYYKTPSFYTYSHYTLGSTIEHISSLNESYEQIGFTLAVRPSITYLLGEKKNFGVVASFCESLNTYGNIWHAFTFKENDYNLLFYTDISLGVFYVL